MVCNTCPKMRGSQGRNTWGCGGQSPVCRCDEEAISQEDYLIHDEAEHNQKKLELWVLGKSYQKEFISS